MRGSVLIVDDDRVVSSLVSEVLAEEGFAVVELTQPATIQHEVARLEPDVVLLDGWDATGYGQSWIDAARLHARARPIAVIMFTSHTADLQEARLGESERSQAAAFVGVVAKPFDLQEMIDIVARAVEEPATVLSLR